MKALIQSTTAFASFPTPTPSLPLLLPASSDAALLRWQKCSTDSIKRQMIFISAVASQNMIYDDVFPSFPPDFQLSACLLLHCLRRRLLPLLLLPMLQEERSRRASKRERETGRRLIADREACGIRPTRLIARSARVKGDGETQETRRERGADGHRTKGGEEKARRSARQTRAFDCSCCDDDGKRSRCSGERGWAGLGVRASDRVSRSALLAPSDCDSGFAEHCRCDAVLLLT